MRGIIASLVVVVVLAACGGGGGYQDACEENDDCDDGLQCLQTFKDTGSSCSPSDAICNKPCTSDADCIGISTLGLCGTDCSGAKVCA